MKNLLPGLILFLLSSAVAAGSTITIGPGAGSFIVAGGEGREDRSIEVHYYRPATLTTASPVLMVLPGAGRNGGDYRDAWKEAAERHGVLILSPSYDETHYPGYWSYSLGNMAASIRLDISVQVDANPAQWKLADVLKAAEGDALLDRLASDSAPLHQLALLSLAGMLQNTAISAGGVVVNPDRSAWIYADFDWIFQAARDALGLATERHDMFGHSAGGQILHRYALFHPDGHADRIVAANSGWYTLPGFDEPFPYGLAGTGITEADLRRAFASRLIVFLGERDDEHETRGSLRNTPETSRQGPGRRQRGQYFFAISRATAQDMKAEFNWQLEVVPNVGHEYRRMADAAAEYLYAKGD
ncbi:MAG TPA: hypothetical protein VKZ99_01040 [Gammaproteobacteria bacterium]|nr:hypothetical protein [Gammaproteobacteria bacterium]